jgi:hypothetical protein
VSGASRASADRAEEFLTARASTPGCLTDATSQRPGQLRKVQLAGDEAVSTAAAELILGSDDAAHSTLQCGDLHIMSMSIEEFVELRRRDDEARHQTMIAGGTPTVDRQRNLTTGAVGTDGAITSKGCLLASPKNSYQ